MMYSELTLILVIVIITLCLLVKRLRIVVMLEIAFFICLTLLIVLYPLYANSVYALPFFMTFVTTIVHYSYAIIYLLSIYCLVKGSLTVWLRLLVPCIFNIAMLIQSHAFHIIVLFSLHNINVSSR